MPTFFGRRYMRPPAAIGPTEKRAGLLILGLVAALVAAFVVQVATDRERLFDVDERTYAPAMRQPRDSVRETAGAATAAADVPFPEPGLADWRAPERVDRFTAENLYIKINGRAEAFLQHGVVGLTFGSYHHLRNADRMIDVYRYDMGRPANALGMYRAEEPPGATPAAIGDAAYQVGGAVFFCKRASYVQVLPSRLADARAARKIAERVAEWIGRE